MWQRMFKIKAIFLLLLLASQPVFTQEKIDFVDISKLDSTIIIDLKYATADNFLGDTLYSANICLLRSDVAQRLVRVHQSLQKQGLGLKVWDGYRPLAVQKKMWKKLPDSRYVANPATGSNHNRGAAVDVTLVDKFGNELEMPTCFDDFSEKAGSEYSRVSKQVLKNRKILQSAMRAQGFKTIKSEWWHFNDKDIKKYPVIDLPLDYFEKKKE